MVVFYHTDAQLDQKADELGVAEIHFLELCVLLVRLEYSEKILNFDSLILIILV